MPYKVPQIRVPQFKTKFRVPQFKIRLRSLQVKFPAQVPAVQIPVQGLAQVGQNIPVQPPPQPVPVQLAPAGMVVPAPQIIYQNWIGKKREFSGKLEEDAESHLTRDWMEAHNFPEGDKVRHFCLTLIG